MCCSSHNKKFVSVRVEQGEEQIGDVKRYADNWYRTLYYPTVDKLIFTYSDTDDNGDVSMMDYVYETFNMLKYPTHDKMAPEWKLSCVNIYSPKEVDMPPLPEYNI